MDGLERDLEGRAAAARVNLFSDSGAELADRYRVNATPTYLLLDANGQVLYRQVGGKPDAKAILARVERALTERNP